MCCGDLHIRGLGDRSLSGVTWRGYSGWALLLKSVRPRSMVVVYCPSCCYCYCYCYCCYLTVIVVKYHDVKAEWTGPTRVSSQHADHHTLELGSSDVLDDLLIRMRHL